ncbi:FKBP-type peptidyl-prolyl cis-trans isomerase [Flammeovirgaceae bacterium SG7u.111]|nr:FKBP-type peptidyl-prolyl cis-trans isomerase [Flammeovirgaceae bacterium SG7u.132]WPO37394.1 FKBP-type peptidyl-prolyl cis-trans isomerase [Flammeovirgaceae bacterium SG7u.111]
MKYAFTIMTAGLFLSILGACSNSEDEAAELVEAQKLIDDQLIQNYLSKNNINATKSYSGLYYVIIDEGEEGNDYPTSDATVTLEYKGYFLDGEVFENLGDREEAFVIGLWQLVDGIKEGVQLIKRGGEIQLFIPSHLGYGNNDQGIIPANSVMVYEIKLIDFE